MFKDDDEEEENTFGVTRYPCMPSLVALQQMRNRLHLAFLGRKLMKWTALATGRELRRLAQELYEVYDGFAEDLRNAFILLARSRYFCPSLNSVVCEDIGKKAGVLVQQCGRTVSGVKIVQFEIFETEYPPYPHLGLEKGGQTILETKKAWLELLKRLIMMMQLRAGFLMVELANRNANKKMNVLKRIVIPRTNLSVGYILTELEEMAREEFHRLKKVKEKKKRDYELRNKKNEPKIQPTTCKICEAEQIEPEIQISKQPSKNIEPIAIIAISPESIDKPDLIPSTTRQIKDESKTSTIKHEPCSCRADKAKLITKPLSENTVIAITPELTDKPLLIQSKTKFDTTEKELPPFVELYATPSAKSSIIDEGRNKNVEEDRLEYLKSHLNELIALGKEFVQTGVDKIDINTFLEMCEEAKLKLEQFFAVDNYPKADKKLEQKLEHLKCHLREVIDITKEFKPEATMTSSVENFIKMCEDVDEKLDIYKQGFPAPTKTVDNDKERLEEFKDILTDVEKITKEYNKRGLLSPSAEAFLKSCCEMKLKVDKYMGGKKNIVTISIQPSLEKKREPSIVKSKQPSLENQKQLSIEEQKSEIQPIEEPNINSEIQHLIKHIDETIGLGIEAREEGLISDSVEDIIKSFDEIKSRITCKDVKSQKLQNLQLNIEELMNITERLKTDGTVTASVEDFLKLCEDTINKLYDNERRSPSTLGNRSKANSFSCIDSCMNNTEENFTNAGQTRFEEEIPLLIDAAPCDSCSGVVRIKDTSKESVCITCSQHEQDEDTLRSQMPTTLNSSDQSQEMVCESSKKDELQSNVTEEKQSPLENKIEPTDVDSKLGYFEKKLQKKVKVTRTQMPDGTISEQRETITIKKEKHDPTETSLAEDDDDISDDISDDNIHEQVNICIVPNLSQRGFTINFRKTRSYSGCEHTSCVEPCVRYCLSVDNVFLTVGEQMSFYDTNNCNEIELLDTDLNYMNCLRHPFFNSQNQ